MKSLENGNKFLSTQKLGLRKRNTVITESGMFAQSVLQNDSPRKENKLKYVLESSSF